jgi:hypothetical protein
MKFTEKDREQFFAEKGNATDLRELGPEPEDFEAWCFWKYMETKIKTNIKNKMHTLSPDELRLRCCDYAPDLSWAISQFFMIDKKIEKINRAKKHWYNRKHMYSLKQLKAQGNTSPAVKSIDAYIEYHFTKQWNYWEEKIEDLEKKKKVLEDHKKLWFKLDKTYTTMIYDVNSEWSRTTRDVEQRVKNQPGAITTKNEFEKKTFRPIQTGEDMYEKEFNELNQMNQGGEYDGA